MILSLKFKTLMSKGQLDLRLRTKFSMFSMKIYDEKLFISTFREIIVIILKTKYLCAL